jgi:glyoxylase-like metal-dependent hydrolase (beta-lactamase superfamily II)
MDRIRVGDITVHRIEEWAGEFSPPQFLFPDYSDEMFGHHASQIVPDHYHPASNMIVGFVQSWLLEIDGQRILVDSCSGDGKPRPGIPIFSDLRTPYLANLKRAGFSPEDIDVVICSHLHIDHVGWNTRQVDGEWIPTFTNAKYIMPGIDRSYWDPLLGYASESGKRVNQNVFEDSVQPILDMARHELVEDGYTVASGLTLVSGPGHTPGHMFLRAESAGDRAMFIGDIMHSPMQIYHPEWNSAFCEDAVAARKTRRAVLEEAAQARALVFPAHFAGRHAVRIAERSTGFSPVFDLS